MREEIRNIISNIKPFDPEEQREIENTLEWIDSGAEIFRIEKYDNPPKHIVTYAIIYDLEENKILMTDHKKAKMWLCPGGHIDINEHPKDCALREAKEELREDFELISETPIFLTSLLTFGLQPKHIDVALWYLMKGDSSKNYDFDRREFNDIKWYDLRGIPTNTDPHMWRFIRKLENYFR